MFGLLEFVLLLYWGLISLPATTRHDGFHFSANDVIDSISDSLYYYYYYFILFYFLVENSWACREQATCNLLGSPWAWLCYKFFFFCLKVEHNFFFF